MSQPSPVTPQQAGSEAGMRTSPPVQASSVAAVHAATALVKAATNWTRGRNVCTATGIGGHSYYVDPPSVAISPVDAEHAATALVNVVSQPHELNSSTATLAAS